MKKLVCHLLIVWLALLSVSASAHATTDALHEATHSATHDHDHTLFESISPATASEAATFADTGHTDTCHHSHCGHGHTSAVLTQSTKSFSVNANSLSPQSVANWASSHITSNIERPKWPVTTPAVVNHLS